MGALAWQVVWGLSMILDFMGEIIKGMREYAGLSVDELATAIGVASRTLQRLEANNRKTAVKREMLDDIVAATQVTKPVFAEILATAASHGLGVRLAVKPEGSVVSACGIPKVFRLYADYGYTLPEPERESVERLLATLRSHTAQAENTALEIATDITRRIEDARKRGALEFDE